MCLSSLRSGSQTSETRSATEECAPRLATGLWGLSAPVAALGVETHRPDVRPHSHTASPFCAPKSLGPCKDTCPWSGGHRNPAGPRLLRQRCENRVSKRGHIRRRVGFARGCTLWVWGVTLRPGAASRTGNRDSGDKGSEPRARPAPGAGPRRDLPVARGQLSSGPAPPPSAPHFLEGKGHRDHGGRGVSP